MNPQTYRRELDAIFRKIDRNAAQFGVAFPHIAPGESWTYATNTSGSWTGSFWTGMVLLAYWDKRDVRYLDYLDRYYPLYRQRLDSKTGLDHDLGFLYQLYAVAMAKATGDAKYKRLALDAADHLYARYNPKGRFIRAWESLDSEFRRGKMIIDCMMNLPLLYSASEWTGDGKYAEAAAGHATSSMTYLIREDGSAYHTFDFDPDTGEPLRGENEGGYSDESAWSRGMAWGIYGFCLSHRATGNPDFLEAAVRLADYFIERLPEDRVPPWDFGEPDLAAAPKDASAAAIAASGLLDMSSLLLDRSQAETYETAAHQIIESLVGRYSAVSDYGVDGFLRNCYVRGADGRPAQYYTAFGDYFYMEALMKAAGKNYGMWTVNDWIGA